MLVAAQGAVTALDLDAFACPGCGWSGSAEASLWRCPSCGDPIEFAATPDAPGLDAGTLSGSGLWRYASWIGMRDGVSLGEPETPLLAWGTGKVDILLKNEAALPSGSFKDRGAATLVSWLAAHGAKSAVVDSSGNAGAAMAAYCARAGLGCDVFVPAHASAAKLAQAQVHGARVVGVPGTRGDATAAAVGRAAEVGAPYASHKWHPAFLLGTATIAFELWEQCEGRLPEAVLMPLGSGSLVLGMWRGLSALAAAGLLDRVPRLIGVQSDRCAPIAEVFGHRGRPSPLGAPPSIAEGVQIADPPRQGEIVAVLRASGGTAVTVGDGAIAAAQSAAASRGVLLEPTAAVGLAALDDLDVASALVVVTGSGLKTLKGEAR